MNNKLLTACLCSLFLIVFALPVKSQEIITTNQALSFGEFAMTDFASQMTISIANNGNFSTSGPVLVFVDPTRGEYTLSNGTASANYNITTPTSITLTGPGGNFTIDNIRIRPNNLKFSNAGVDDIRIAADLTSQGGGINYGDGSYTGTLGLTISY